MTTHSTTGRPVDTHRHVRQAEIFASQHRPGEPLLLLANACDVGSALAIARAGAKAIATTSAGVAWSLGVPDATDIGPDRAAAVVERMVGTVPVPVFADIEAGYGPGPDAVAATASDRRTAAGRRAGAGRKLRGAGADSLFVPGLIDLDAIAELAARPLPVAVMVWAVADLASAGVARINLGSAIARTAYAVAARAATVTCPASRLRPGPL